MKQREREKKEQYAGEKAKSTRILSASQLVWDMVLIPTAQPSRGQKLKDFLGPNPAPASLNLWRLSTNPVEQKHQILVTEHGYPTKAKTRHCRERDRTKRISVKEWK
jgi:hypothetical protein